MASKNFRWIQLVVFISCVSAGVSIGLAGHTDLGIAVVEAGALTGGVWVTVRTRLG